jgi:hypothetical protein
LDSDDENKEDRPRNVAKKIKTIYTLLTVIHLAGSGSGGGHSDNPEDEKFSYVTRKEFKTNHKSF